ncbi:hypothetical protein CAAN1_06S03972 [[Candida] anglica]|uniref:PCI domain-containing protein n=1 Tax=[Candida] anglica TaxID=148631 RepID=A0ABP0ENZ5_9ASCO
MSDIHHHVIGQLQNETQYNYYQLLKQVGNSKIEQSLPSVDIRLLNTIELFAFGNYSHYLKYKSKFLELEKELLLKLIKLTILSMTADHEGKTISLDEMESKYQLQTAIEHYGSLTSAMECHLLESIFFSMVDDCLIDVKLDDWGSRVNVMKTIHLRDCYNSEDIQLVVLTEEDIPRNAGTSYAKLEKWLEMNIMPIQKEFEKNRHDNENPTG